MKSIYKGQHCKYDYTNLLNKNTKELDIASQAKEKQEYNEYESLDVKFFFCNSFIQKLKMQMLRKKILRFAKYLSTKNIKISELMIFKQVDYNYNYFVGKDKNLALNLIMHNGFYNKQAQGKLFKFIEKIQDKNRKKIPLIYTDQFDNMTQEQQLNKFKDKSLFDQDKEYSQFSKQTALNVNTLKRYKEQEHLLQSLMNRPDEALAKIIDQAFENNKNVEIVRKNTEAMHQDNIDNLNDLENWVNQMIFR